MPQAEHTTVMVTPAGGIYHHSWRAAEHAAKRTSLPAKQPGAFNTGVCNAHFLLCKRMTGGLFPCRIHPLRERWFPASD